MTSLCVTLYLFAFLSYSFFHSEGSFARLTINRSVNGLFFYYYVIININYTLAAI